MRVLYVIDSLAAGGAETSLAALAPHLVAGGIDLEVAYFIERPGVHDRLLAAGAQLTHLGNGGGRRGRIARVRDKVASDRPDLVHTTLFEADVAGRIGARLARTPVVTSLVNDSYGPKHGSGQDLGIRLHLAHGVDALTARLARRFHANSELVASVMSRRLAISRHRIDVVHRGRDADALGTRTPERRASGRHALGMGDEPIVLALGRHEPQKGFDILIAAVPALRAAIPDVRVIVAGREGTHTDELKRLIRTHRVDDVVTLLGHRGDVAELLAAADVLAFPSRREGLPGTLIEALALECPVVATDLPNVREVMGDCAAALVAVDDARGLADTLIRALREPERLRVLAAHGRTRFLEMFTIEQSAAGMLAFYERSR